MLKINIANLKDGEHEFDFDAPPEELDIDSIEIIKNIYAAVRVYKSRNQISINVNIRGKFNLQCDRCLENYISDFSNTFDIIYKFTFADIVTENGDDDIKFIAPNTKYIDLKDEIRDYILLSIPMRKVPEEKDDVCSYCNKDVSLILSVDRQEEINPIWEKLIKAKTK